ncbi:MAG: CsgG/HfaB family protein [Nanoarchaeota archaeon]|nr:CsgG/HfaB family protein [Nanoarchaeota archaeon]
MKTEQSQTVRIIPKQVSELTEISTYQYIGASLDSCHTIKTIAVLDFESYNISDEESKILTERLRSELIKNYIFNIIERSKMEEVLDEQGFQLSGCTSDECVIEVGKLLGASHMIAGSIGYIGSTYSVNSRLIDVESGKILESWIEDCKGKIDELLSVNMRRLAQKISGITSEK